MSATDRAYKNGTSNLDGYSEKFVTDEVAKYGLNTPSPFNIKCESILDIACGNGVFSKEFSNYFTVRGEELSSEGIKRAELENKNSKITYKTCDVLLETSKHDIVFTRCPSFFARNNIYSDTFSNFLDHLMRRCNKIFAFGQYNKEPGQTAYEYHSKEDIQNVFSKYGTILKNEMIGSYLYVIVKKNVPEKHKNFRWQYSFVHKSKEFEHRAFHHKKNPWNFLGERLEKWNKWFENEYPDIFTAKTFAGLDENNFNNYKKVIDDMLDWNDSKWIEFFDKI